MKVGPRTGPSSENTSEEGLYLQTIYFPLVEYGKQRGHMSLDVQVSSPSYRIDRRPPVGYLDVSSTYNEKENALCLNCRGRVHIVKHPLESASDRADDSTLLLVNVIEGS